MLLLCGCAKTDNKTKAEGQQDTGIETQQPDISQEVTLELPEIIAELADSRLKQLDLDTLVS